MSGILYLCATPIGNLGDMTMRAIETLREADLIAAEDTRNSLKLLNHFGISAPITSYHEHNKYEKADVLIRKLLDGENIALITDAGTPGISDPGEVLVEKCIENGIPVTSLPGCCALINALILSGLPTSRFSFEGFLPSEKKKRSEILEELKDETRTVILYEAPHHLKETLKDLLEGLGNRKISLCRELTKKFEEVIRTDLEGALKYYDQKDPKGEYVLVIEGIDRKVLKELESQKWDSITLEEHLMIYTDSGLDRKEAMKRVAKDRGTSKREIYNQLL